MTASLSYDLSGAGTDDHARIGLTLERLGWTSPTGSEWRHEAQSPQDFFNRIVPGLYMFRRLILERGLKLTYVSPDIHYSGTWQRSSADGEILMPGSQIPLVQPDCSDSRQRKLSEAKLRRALDGEALRKPSKGTH